MVDKHLEHLSGTVALAETEGGEAEPVGKDSWGESSIEVWLGTGGTSAFIVWVKGQQAVQAVLLFTPATNQGDIPLWEN